MEIFLEWKWVFKALTACACACDSELDSCHMQLFEFHLALVSHLWRMPQIWAPKHSYGCSEYSLLLVHIHQKWKKIAPKIASVIELSKLLSGVKNIHVVPTDPILFFLPTVLFFQRDWPCDPIFSRWLRAAHTACQNGICCHTNYWTKLPKFVHRKYASLVNIDVGTLLQIAQQKTAKTMKKIFKKKIYFQPTDPNFFTIWNRNHRYFFYASDIQIK